MKVYSKIYLVKDVFGNKASAICEDDTEIITIFGLKKDNCEPSYFEGKAGFLSFHCVEDGLEMKVIEKIYKFDELWNDSILVGKT